jgi:hypothetical protein
MHEVGEAEFLEAAGSGHILDCGDGGTHRPLDAALVRRCCHELKGRIDPRGIRLRNAKIVGSLDLAGLDIPFPLRFEKCEFDSPLLAEGARLHELAVRGSCELPGLLANGMRVYRDLDLSRTRVTGAHKTSASTSKRAALWLCESSIGGRLLCVNTVIDGGGERAIQADRMHVGGNARLIHRFTACGEIRLIGARIDGSLDLTGASLESAGTGLALDLAEAVIEGSIFVIDGSSGRPSVQGRIDMGGARIGGQVLIRNATLKGQGDMPVGSAYSRSRVGGTALSAPRLSVGAEVTLEDSCQVFGGMDLAMSELSSLSIGPGCSLTAPGRTALDLNNAEFLSTLTIGQAVHVRGTIRLSGARIHGNLCLRGAILSDPERRSLVAARGAKIDGEAELHNVTAMGGSMNFRAATIGSFFFASGACLNFPSGHTLTLHQASVKGSVWLDSGFESKGVVDLSRATIDGRLVCTQGSFTCPAPSGRNQRGHAIEAISAIFRGGIDLGWETVSPSVDFTGATTSFLADDPKRWPTLFAVAGFTYDRFEQPQGGSSSHTWDHAARCAWLGHQTPYDAGPYEQAARVFREHGYTDGAKAILIAQRRRARRAIIGRWALARRVLDTAYDSTVRYGYRPGRVLWLLLFLLIAVTGSLEIPAAQASMRATTTAGTVYTTRGPALAAKAAPAISAGGPATSAGGPAAPAGGPATSAPTAVSPASPPVSAAAKPPADACGDGQVRCFNAFLYAFDTVIPLVSLEQRATWYPDVHLRDGTFMEWWLNTATILGWLLSSVFVLSLANLARSA